jgi:methionine-rich copper-binding protein CopC
MTLSSSLQRLAALLGLSALLVLLPSAPALAHARLLETDPADGARLSQPPKQVRLSFNEPIEAEFNPVKVLDQQGKRVDQGNARVDPDDRKVAVADLKQLAEGSYTVEWRVISADTHPVNGTYGFAVVGASTDESQNATEAVGGSKVQSSDQAEPESVAQQDTGGGSNHIIHIVALGVGVLVMVVLALRKKR